MNKQFFLLLISVLYLTISCTQQNKNYLIKGTVTANIPDNEVIYLVPFKGATAENVDSCIVRNRSFTFEGIADSTTFKILRMRPVLRAKCQELLVIIEPGTITVNIDSLSSGSGTPENDILQEWKEYSEQIKQHRKPLYEKLKTADDLTKDALQKELEQIMYFYSQFNYNFLKKHTNSFAGKFVYQMVQSTLSPEQKEEIESLMEQK